MTQLRTDLHEIIQRLKTYLKHPVKEIRRLPDWEWRRVLLAQVMITLITGPLSGLVQRSAFWFFANILLTPILTLIIIAVTSLFFYYSFQIFAGKMVEFRHIYTAVFFANIPFFIFQVIMGYFPPILLIGLAFTALLLVVAFVANFQIPRQFVTRLISAIYIVFVAVYLMAWFSTSRSADRWHGTSETDAPEVELGKAPEAH